MEEGADLLSADDADEESGLYCASTFEKASFPPQISEFLDPVPPGPPTYGDGETSMGTSTPRISAAPSAKDRHGR